MLQHFENHVREFAKSDTLTDRELKANFAMGLAGESGEVVDLLKKHLFHGDDLDRAKLISELGDTLWYLIAICQQYEIHPSEVMQVNIEKLRRRHGGTKFDRARANFGKDVAIPKAETSPLF
jgi:NTP pyrophosphatase (non-canonical NTP hydrolase)